MTQILSLSCVSFIYVSISYVLAARAKLLWAFDQADNFIAWINLNLDIFHD